MARYRVLSHILLFFTFVGTLGAKVPLYFIVGQVLVDYVLFQVPSVFRTEVTVVTFVDVCETRVGVVQPL